MSVLLHMWVDNVTLNTIDKLESGFRKGQLVSRLNHV